MNILMQKLPDILSSKLGRTALIAGKHSPTILFATGVVGVVATAVTASRSTLKLEEVIDRGTTDLAKAQILRDEQRIDYSEQDYKQDALVIYSRTAVDIVKLYALPISLGFISIACLTKSHRILTRRNAAITAAYSALDLGFREYRDRVKQEFGPDIERHFRYGSERQTITQDTPEGPKEITVRRANIDTDHSIYARFFDQLSRVWQKEPEYNLVFLRAQQNYANDMLKARGHLFLNEVYDLLGIDRSGAGQVVGWVIGDTGDNYVDFGIFNQDNPRAIDFVNGREGAILLDFNVDGVVYDRI
jgi:Family of unknown function (DUF6353)